MSTLAAFAAGSAFQGYAYAYPHKTAYRPLEPPLPLAAVWADDDLGALSLYLHVPFCEMRCGFCNLFTLAHADTAAVDAFLVALTREAEAVSTALGPRRRFARVAVGGGTPTFLSARALAQVFALARDVMGAALAEIPVAVEVSPATADDARLDVLEAFGVDRISVGVQTFDEEEARALGRPQRTDEVRRALSRIRARRFPVLNIDLIYGAAGQTPASWLRSVDTALRFEPEELYLYPLYVRPLTGLGRRGLPQGDTRLSLYRAGRERLLAAGYEQRSMRMFRARHAPPLDGPSYSCQHDGMVGLGPGARSYTTRLHYATEYAVGRSGVRAILEDYAHRESFAEARYGVMLTDAERHRRFAIQSLLQVEGLDRRVFHATFGLEARVALPQLDELVAENLATERDGVITLCPSGLELSDVIGPWLASGAMKERMRAYAWR